MSKTDINIKEMNFDLGKLKNVDIRFGKVVKDWEEKEGPDVYPSVTHLRNWDFKLLKRYKPFYAPICDMCCLCTYGKCDLSKGKKGACGLSIGSQQSRIVLIACCIGATAHAGHARHLLEHLIDKFGPDCKIDMGKDISIEAPITRLVCGIKPETLSDFLEPLDYVHEQITHLLAASHTGQEGSEIDLESKALHVGMLDFVGMEIADICQICALNLPKGSADLVEIGMGSIDTNKPAILLIGHNISAGVEVLDYLDDKNLTGEVEVCGICCTSLDITRYKRSAKIVGPLSSQLKFIRTGIADVIMVDEQCIRTDILEQAKKVNSYVLATNDKMCGGLEDITHKSVDEIVNYIKKNSAGLVLDAEKAGAAAVEIARSVYQDRQKDLIPDKNKIIEEAARCVKCENCIRNCPVELSITEALDEAKKGNLEPLGSLYDKCLGCGRCETICERNIQIIDLINGAARKRISEEKFNVRAGRGPVTDVEIRKVGSPIVFGEIPGIIALVGCPNYEEGPKELVEMTEEFLKRRFIVVTSGCAAMDIAMYKDEEGKTLYEKYPGDFDAGCIANVGSCVANSHIVGAAVKVANIFARRSLRGNFEEIADYILNRLGAVGIAWGAYSQKAASIATGVNRFGIPVILGPKGTKYRRLYLGKKHKKEDWEVYNARTGKKVNVGPAPEHLIYAAESKEEAIVYAVKLCIRPNDTSKGRQIKLAHYIDLHKKYFGSMPDDLDLFIRQEADAPLSIKVELLKDLKKKGWKPTEIPDPTLLKRMVKK